MFALIEFAFVFSGMLGISYATRDAALIAAEAGSGLAGSDKAADCAIIQTVDRAVSAPADDNRIQSITIYKANQSGVEISGVSNVWTRGGSTACPDGTTDPVYAADERLPRGDGREPRSISLQLAGRVRRATPGHHRGPRCRTSTSG